ncbi:hypothetical protein RSSM_04699 [Rhodopirellula sallentina SM41]|uniref:Uncharacterized protein n=1 Tax=Rhodopirellula sallentina SM41 TaxID=1263870 RepID=M5UCW2_9BACT|nr:hypothetical protein RSSM_04699 [Rhodopirellula sallentina SM41]
MKGALHNLFSREHLKILLWLLPIARSLYSMTRLRHSMRHRFR